MWGSSPDDFDRNPWWSAFALGACCGATVAVCVYIQTRSAFFTAAGGVTTFVLAGAMPLRGRQGRTGGVVDMKPMPRAFVPAAMGLVVAAVFRSWVILAIAVANGLFWVILLSRARRSGQI